jgi:hypothetical protein
MPTNARYEYSIENNNSTHECRTLDIHESEKYSNISSSSTRSGDTECAFERSAEEFSLRKGGLFLFIAVVGKGREKGIFSLFLILLAQPLCITSTPF